jgi:hypothetical protein
MNVDKYRLEYAAMSIRDLVTQHRFKTLNWEYYHGKVFQLDSEGLYIDPDPQDEALLAETMDRCYAIEQEIIKRFDR